MKMERCQYRFMVLLIDFDGKQERLTEAKAKIPAHLADRVFILGALSEPEALKQANLRSYEEIGRALAEDCAKEPTRFGGTISSDTMPVSLTVYASTYVRSCSRPIEAPRLPSASLQTARTASGIVTLWLSRPWNPLDTTFGKA